MESDKCRETFHTFQVTQETHDTGTLGKPDDTCTAYMTFIYICTAYDIYMTYMYSIWHLVCRHTWYRVLAIPLLKWPADQCWQTGLWSSHTMYIKSGQFLHTLTSPDSLPKNIWANIYVHIYAHICPSLNWNAKWKDWFCTYICKNIYTYILLIYFAHVFAHIFYTNICIYVLRAFVHNIHLFCKPCEDIFWAHWKRILYIYPHKGETKIHLECTFRLFLFSLSFTLFLSGPLYICFYKFMSSQVVALTTQSQCRDQREAYFWRQAHSPSFENDFLKISQSF